MTYLLVWKVNKTCFEAVGGHGLQIRAIGVDMYYNIIHINKLCGIIERHTNNNELDGFKK